MHYTLRLMLFLFPLALNSIVYSQSYNIEKVIENREKIAINGMAFKLDSSYLKVSEGNATRPGHILAFTNRHHSLILLSEKDTSRYDRLFLSLYDSTGTRLWKTDLEKTAPERAYIPDNNDFLVLITNSIYMDISNKMCLIYGKDGSLIHADENVGWVYANSNKDFFIYTKEKNYRSDSLLFLVDLRKSSPEIKQLNFQGSVRVNAISKEGNHFICHTKNEIFSFKTNGKLIWSRELQGRSGFFEISDNGDYYVRLFGKMELEFGDNKTGKEKFVFVDQVIDHKKFHPIKIAFVENSNSYVSCVGGIAAKTAMVVIYNYQGEVVYTKIFRDIPSITDFQLIKEADIIEVFFNGLLKDRIDSL